MNLIDTPFIDVTIRNYEVDLDPDRHGHAQLVLPLSGSVLLEVEGREGRIDPLQGALVAAGAWHSQCSEAASRSIVLNVDQSLVALGERERLLAQPFAAISPAVRKLMEFMQLMLEQRAASPAVVQGWAPLLLDALASAPPQERSRLAALLAQVERNPGQPWSTESMARCAHVSVSRLHALFRDELDASPHAWLLQKRLALACEYLAGSQRAISDVALYAGFSDQSALTRAMRQNMDTTPAAYRRENKSRTQ